MTDRKIILSVAYIPALGRQRELLLRMAGYDVVTVKTVVEAAYRLTATPFDLVIIGHAVPPKETGAIAAFVARAQEVPILFLHPGTEGRDGAGIYFNVADGSEAFLKRVASIIVERSKAQQFSNWYENQTEDRTK